MSVSDERREAHEIISRIVESTFPSHTKYHGNSFVTQEKVITKMYGSMASGLAISSSDIDLVVVGLDFGGNRDY